MTESIKMGMKMLRYGWGLKTSIVLATVQFVLAIFLGKMYVGSYMVLMIAMWPAQLLWSLNISGIVQTSPWKKRMQTTVPTCITSSSILLIYLLLLVRKLSAISKNPEIKTDIIFELIMISFTILLIMLYVGIAYKIFYLATILFVVSFSGTVMLVEILLALGVFHNISLGGAIGSGFGAIIAGTLLQYGELLLLYKRPVSKGAQMTGLRKSI